MLLMFFAVSLACPSLGAYGLNEFDRNKKCELEISVRNEKNKDEPVTDAEVTLYRVADVKFVDSKAVYECNADFSGYARTLETIDSDKDAGRLFDHAVQHRVKGTTQYTDKNGRTKFSQLKAGVYLVAEIQGKQDYARFKPFLAVLPYDNNGKWEFSVLAMPKIEIDGDDDTHTSFKVRKIWNDDGNNRPDKITVHLLCNNEVFDTVELSADNSWEFTWNELPYGKQWTVKEQDVPSGYTVTYTRTQTGYIISNTRSLAQTGQLRWPIPVLAGSGLVLIIIGVALRRSRDEKKHG